MPFFVKQKELIKSEVLALVFLVFCSQINLLIFYRLTVYLKNKGVYGFY